MYFADPKSFAVYHRDPYKGLLVTYKSKGNIRSCDKLDRRQVKTENKAGYDNGKTTSAAADDDNIDKK